MSNKGHEDDWVKTIKDFHLGNNFVIYYNQRSMSFSHSNKVNLHNKTKLYLLTYTHAIVRYLSYIGNGTHFNPNRNLDQYLT